MNKTKIRAIKKKLKTIIDKALEMPESYGLEQAFLLYTTSTIEDVIRELDKWKTKS